MTTTAIQIEITVKTVSQGQNKEIFDRTIKYIKDAVEICNQENLVSSELTQEEIDNLIDGLQNNSEHCPEYDDVYLEY